MVNYNRRHTDRDDEDLDFIARARMRQTDNTVVLMFSLIAIVAFIIGMVIGSALHDFLFHALER